MLRVTHRLAESHPMSVVAARLLLQSYLIAAAVSLELGQIQPATGMVANHQQMLQFLEQQAPTEIDVRMRMASLMQEAELAEAKRDMSSAVPAFARAVGVSRREVDAHPDLPAAWRRLSLALDGLARAALALDDLGAAEEAIDESLAIVRQLNAAGSPSPDRDLSVSLELLAGLAQRRGDLARAVELESECVVIRRRLWWLEPLSAAAVDDLERAERNFQYLLSSRRAEEPHPE